MPVAQKHRAISRQEKMAFSTPHWVVLGLPSPYPRVCTDGRTGGRTLTSQPKFLGSIDNQICLAMVLRYNIKKYRNGKKESVLTTWDKFMITLLAPVVQRADNSIHRINH